MIIIRLWHYTTGWERGREEVQGMVFDTREVLPIMCHEIMPKADNLLITEMHHCLGP